MGSSTASLVGFLQDSSCDDCAFSPGLLRRVLSVQDLGTQPTSARSRLWLVLRL